MADARSTRAALERRLDTIAAQAGRDVELALHREAESWPHATGYTSERISHTVQRTSQTRRRITWTSPSKHGDFREKGTRPHVIRPRGPGYPLRFYWPKVGREVRFWKVNHPGNKPMPWFGVTIRKALRSLRLR